MANGLLDLRVKLPPAHLSVTDGVDFTLSFLLLNIKWESCEYQFLKFLVWPDRKSNPLSPFQWQTLNLLDY